MKERNLIERQKAALVGLLGVVAFARIVGGIVIVCLGVYLIQHHHGTAGGWLIIGGLLFGSVSIGSDDD